MTQKEIEKLQARLNKLKGEPKPIHGGNLGQQFEEMGKSFQGMTEQIPHIKVGSDKPAQYEPWAEKARKWLFIGLLILVGGTALILIVWRILARFF